MYKKRIIILDNDEDFCLAAAALIKNSERFNLIKVYNDSKEALKKLPGDFPEIVIMDLDFPELKASEFMMKAREKIPRLDILITTDYTDEQVIFHTFSHGASGYLLKKKCLNELLGALQILAEGGSPIDPWIARQIIHSIQINEISPLSSRELMVLRLLIQGKTYTAIADELVISGETVKTHLKNIYRKLKVNTKAQAIKKAITDQLITTPLGLYFQNT